MSPNIIVDSVHGVIRSIPELLQQETVCRWTRSKVLALVSDFEGRQVLDLLNRVQTVSDPFVLWLIHRELDKRGVPPCLRVPYREESPELGYITWLADMYWLAKRYPNHQTEYRSFRHLFAYPPGGAAWHKNSKWIYQQSRSKSGHYFSRALRVTDAMRQPLALLVSREMQGVRRMLHRLPKYREALLAHAMTHRDRQGLVLPGELTRKRVEILRLYMLSGHNGSTAGCWYTLLHGEAISRQVVAKHLAFIEKVAGLTLPRGKSLRYASR